MTRTRVEVYNFLLGACASIPDPTFFKSITSKAFTESLMTFKSLKDKQIAKGADLILQFLAENKETSPEQMIEAIGVDRTKIIRIPHLSGLRAPYESQYIKTKNASVILLDLKKTYLAAGFSPENSVESLDFICVELDFLRLLNQKIAEGNAPAEATLLLQKQFMNDHLSRWLGDYCQGWLGLLSGFLKLEQEYLDIMCS
jgi:nitrate reductase assembly molybdenum cofactor insertion protein NarJ